MFLNFLMALQCTSSLLPENMRELYGFLFSGARERVHWERMVLFNTNFYIILVLISGLLWISETLFLLLILENICQNKYVCVWSKRKRKCLNCLKLCKYLMYFTDQTRILRTRITLYLTKFFISFLLLIELIYFENDGHFSHLM